MNWEYGNSRCKLLYIEWIKNKVLPFSTGNYVHYLMLNYNGKEQEKVCVCICVYIYIYIYESESESEVTQLCPTLCNPMDCSLPGSSTHGIFQARVVEWGAIAFSNIYTHTQVSHFAVQKKLTQHCKLTILQLKFLNNHNKIDYSNL